MRASPPPPPPPNAPSAAPTNRSVYLRLPITRSLTAAIPMENPYCNCKLTRRPRAVARPAWTRSSAVRPLPAPCFARHTRLSMCLSRTGAAMRVCVCVCSVLRCRAVLTCLQTFQPPGLTLKGGSAEHMRVWVSTRVGVERCRGGVRRCEDQGDLRRVRPGVHAAQRRDGCVNAVMVYHVFSLMESRRRRGAPF